ncbi:hypothetical protein, partial [Sphingopyxis sp. HXXIV]|uniref:hypothetical protein n=1 Tax=Sphingopyxis sp. HXXIV TaxID=1759075 RepID=UPI0012E3C35E
MAQRQGENSFQADRHPSVASGQKQVAPPAAAGQKPFIGGHQMQDSENLRILIRQTAAAAPLRPMLALSASLLGLAATTAQAQD